MRDDPLTKIFNEITSTDQKIKDVTKKIKSGQYTFEECHDMVKEVQHQVLKTMPRYYMFLSATFGNKKFNTQGDEEDAGYDIDP